MSDYSKIAVGQTVTVTEIGNGRGYGYGEITEIGKKSFTIRMKAYSGGRAWNQKFGLTDGIAMGNLKDRFKANV